MTNQKNVVEMDELESIDDLKSKNSIQKEIENTSPVPGVGMVQTDENGRFVIKLNDVENDILSMGNVAKICAQGISNRYNGSERNAKIFMRGENAIVERVENGGDKPVFRLLKKDDFQAMIFEGTRIYKLIEKKNGEILSKNLVSLPNDIVNSTYHRCLRYPWLPLDRIVEFPIYDDKWKLVSDYGYHRQSKQWIGFNGKIEAHEKPSEDEVLKAKETLDDIFGEFAFAKPIDKSVAIGMLCEPYIRHKFDNAPIWLVTKPKTGMGGTFLVNIFHLITTGREITPTTIDQNSEKFQAKFQAMLFKPPSIYCLDNIQKTIHEEILQVITTAEGIEFNPKFANTNVCLKLKTTMVATGNNVQLRTDLARRVVRINIDSNMENPGNKTYKRKGSELKQLVLKNRNAIISAILTLINNWVAQGQPTYEYNKPSFDAWAGTIGGILRVNGYDDESLFQTKLSDITSNVDTSDNDELRNILQLWFQKYGEKPIVPAQILADERVQESIRFMNSVKQSNDLSPKGYGAKFGKLMSRNNDCIFTIEHKVNGVSTRTYNVEVKIGCQIHHGSNKEYFLTELSRTLIKGIETVESPSTTLTETEIGTMIPEDEAKTERRKMKDTLAKGRQILEEELAKIG